LAGEDIIVESRGYESRAEIIAGAEHGTTNDADVLIDAFGNVEVYSQDVQNGFARIMADAHDGQTNTADVSVVADGDVSVEAYDYQSFAGILASATISEENKANIEIDADGSVTVLAVDDAEAAIDAYASNDDESNTAGIIINAGEDVEVIGQWGGIAEIFAESSAGLDNTADIQIATENGDVLVQSTDAHASIKSLARWAENTNTATVDIDAVGGDVIVEDSGYEYNSAEIIAEAYAAGSSNVADVTVNATAVQAAEDDRLIGEGGNVEVIANDGGHAEIAAYAADAGGGKVKVLQEEPPEMPETDPTSNTANVTINTTGVVVTKDVPVQPSSPLGTLDEMPSEVPYEEPVYEEVTYLDGGNVEVMSYQGGHAAITAQASLATDNTAAVQIDADGDVLVTDVGGFGGFTAEITAMAQNAYKSNTANVNIDAQNVLVAALEGNANITARATDIMYQDIYGPSAQIANGSVFEPDGTENNASVEINTNASESYDPEGPLPYLIGMVPGDIADDNPQLDEFLQGLAEGGHVVVGGINGGSARIFAEAYNGTPGTVNASDVLVCADGGVLVGAGSLNGPDGVLMGAGLPEVQNGSTAEIKALAAEGFSNTADLGIGADLGLGVLAVGPGSDASIAAEAFDGHILDADLVACTNGPALVLGLGMSDSTGNRAEIFSRAINGYDASASTGLCAGEDIIVAAYEAEAMVGSEAVSFPTPLYQDQVKLDVEPQYPDDEEPAEIEPTTADAETVVVSKKGVVAVIDYDEAQPSTAGIVSEAYGGELNNALTGVLAGAELSAEDVFAEEPPMTLLGSLLEQFGDDLSSLLGEDVTDLILPGSVYVAAFGPDGHAKILSKAADGVENTAETVVAAPGEVVVTAEDDMGMPVAQIKSQAGDKFEDDALNTATTRIYASEVDVEVPGINPGNGIWAFAAGLDVEGSEPPHVPYTGDQTGYDPDPDQDGTLDFILTEYVGDYGDGEVIWMEENEQTGTTAELIIQDYSERTGLPECPECPCREDGEDDEPPIGPPAPLGVAPLPPIEEVGLQEGGCPALMEWLANEVGVPEDVEVTIAAAFVSSTDCQPCAAAARLKAAATTLADEDGSHMAAMNQVFSEVAPADAPFTPEMANSIVDAFSGRVNDGTQYATAIEYIDAFVEYVSILNTELGSPVSDPVAYVMEKYGSDIRNSDNENMTAFLATRLESGDTFAQ
jgi:hypothetical protein